MGKIKQFPRKTEPGFVHEVRKDGYHIFSLKKAKKNGFYLHDFPDYPVAKLKELSEGDIITIRAFFMIKNNKTEQIDSGLLDLEVEHVENDHLLGVIVTQLPKGFPLETGTSLEIYEDEILSIAT